jgi:hypothetical protein
MGSSALSATNVPQTTIDAIDRNFQQQRDKVAVLRQRAAAQNTDRVRALDDLVPLLFPHTVYKSYPAQLVDNGRWPMMNRWLETLSTHKINVDVAGVADVDGWLARLAAAGHFVAPSSGTSGKSSFIDKTGPDIDAIMKNHVATLAAAGVAADKSWHVVSLSPVSANIVATRMRDLLDANFARPDNLPAPKAPPETEGPLAFMSRMIRMRRAMAEGTASPDEIAALKQEQDRRAAETNRQLEFIVDRVLERRSEKMLFGSMMAFAWRFVEALRARGIKPGDITGENVIYMAGGTKGVELPPNHIEQIQAMLNITPARFVQLYSMQEINLAMWKCAAERYHAPDDLVLMVLDEPGEKLAPIIDGQVDGRAAFFDLTVEARWGGIISGDYIRADYRTCPCGRPGPTVFPDITRYMNKVDGDKISCAGTMDAYVRGSIED